MFIHFKAAAYLARSSNLHDKLWVSPMLLFMLAVVLIVGSLSVLAMAYALQGRLAYLTSIWLQVTVVFASIVVFLFIQKICFSLAENTSFFSPFAVAVSRPFMSPEKFEELSAKLVAEPQKIRR